MGHKKRLLMILAVLVGGASVLAYYYISVRPETQKVAQMAQTPIMSRDKAPGHPPIQVESKPSEDETHRDSSDARQPVDLKISTDDLLDELEIFAEARDQEGCEAIYSDLLNREDAPDKASDRLRAFLLNVEAENFSRHTLFYLSLVASDAGWGELLGTLRDRWSRSNEKAAEAWDLVNMMSSDVFAARALSSDYDVALCDAMIFMVERWLERADTQSREAHLAGIAELYDVMLPEGEVPDPWLSQVLVGVVRLSRTLSQAQCDPLRQFATDIAGSRVLSTRLRIQARTAFVDAAVGLFGVIDQIAASESVAEAGKFLAAFISSQLITSEDMSILIEALEAKYGMEKVADVFSVAFKNWSKIADIEAVREMSEALSEALMRREDTDSAYELNLILRVLAVKSFTKQVLADGPNAIAFPLYAEDYTRREGVMRRLVGESVRRSYEDSPATQKVYDLTLLWTLIDSGLEYGVLVELLCEHVESIVEWEEMYSLRLLEHLGRHRLVDVSAYPGKTRTVLRKLADRDAKHLSGHERRRSEKASLPRAAHYLGKILMSGGLLQDEELVAYIRRLALDISADATAEKAPLYSQYAMTLRELKELGVELPE